VSGSGLLKRDGLRAGGPQRPSHTPSKVLGASPKPGVSRPESPLAPAAHTSSISPPAIDRGPTPAQIEAIKEAARQEGLALGRRQARDEADKAIGDKIASLDAVVKSVSKAWLEERDRMLAVLADFAFVATCRMLGERAADPQIAIDSVQSTLDACEGWKDITIEVNPSDAELLRRALARDESPGSRTMRVEASPDVRLGGCRITSSEGSLDARLEVQISQLRERLDAERVRRDLSA
jgi:flagellar assembly protein FliH